jgi:uncharacterized membrane protein (DUF485 family)
VFALRCRETPDSPVPSAGRGRQEDTVSVSQQPPQATQGKHSLSRHHNDVYVEIERGGDFQELKRRFRNFAFPMTALFLAWYLLYVILSGWARGFMGHKLLGNINVAYILGLSQFISTFVIAWIYSRHARNSLDPLATRIRDSIEDAATGAAHGLRKEER